jgi:hypothetical protein
MPDDMYHTSDPDIEASTHQIRKQFHDTIRDIEYQGQQIENVEAFLISTNDMSKLHQLFHGSHNVPGGPGLDGQMKMYGVKVIESQYVPQGTIFKVFKNDPPMVYPETDLWGQAGSGVIPGWEDNLEPQEPNNELLDFIYEKAEKKKPDTKKYSTKRRIELDK